MAALLIAEGLSIAQQTLDVVGKIQSKVAVAAGLFALWCSLRAHSMRHDLCWRLVLPADAEGLSIAQQMLDVVGKIQHSAAVAA